MEIILNRGYGDKCMFSISENLSVCNNIFIIDNYGIWRWFSMDPHIDLDVDSSNAIKVVGVDMI